MSTTNVESWTAAPLAEFGPIYPFVGSEGLLVLLLLAAWLGWHVWQIKLERRQEEEQLSLLKKNKGEKDDS